MKLLCIALEVVFTFAGILAVTTIFFVLAGWSFIPLLGLVKVLFPS